VSPFNSQNLLVKLTRRTRTRLNKPKKQMKIKKIKYLLIKPKNISAHKIIIDDINQEKSVVNLFN